MSMILFLSVYFDIVYMLIVKAVAVVTEGSMTLQDLVYRLVNMPKRLVQTAFRIQMEILYLPIRLANSFHRLIFKRKEAAGNCDRSVQMTSLIEHSACNKSVQVNHVEPCNKYVQVNSDIEEESPRDKSVQVAGDEFPCNKSMQTEPDSEQEFPSDKSVQTESDSEQEFPSDKFVQTVSDSEQELSCKKYGNANTDSLQNMHLAKHIGLDSAEDIHANEKKNTLCIDNHAVCLTSTDYIRYSELVKQHTFKLIEELSNITNCVPSSNETARALRSLQYLHARREKVNNEFKSMQNEIITEAIPVIKESFCKNQTQKKNIDEITNFKFQKAKNDLHPNQKRETLPTEEISHGHQVLNLSIEVVSILVDIITQEVISLKARLATTNNRMNEVLKSSGSLFEEQSKLNERFSKLVALSSKISDLQNELGESNCKALTKVVADRDEMQLKLIALERIIKEEEEYLDDVSCESGYDELENRIASQFSSLG